MKNTKRIIAALLCAAMTFTLFACTKNNGNKLPNDFFDNKTENTKGTSEGDNEAEKTVSSSEKDSTQSDNTEKDAVTKENEKEDTAEDANENNEDERKDPEDKTSDSDEDKVIHVIPEVPFSHSEEEKKEIISRYNDAESFYYDMLFQNFELDNMDVIVLDSDGYETEYHRVILDDINSLSELRAAYGAYFTSGFISGIDFSAYRENGGKLYCAATTGSSGSLTAKYTCSVESTDEDSATVVRRTDGGSQKISAEKIGSTWFFDGIAMR